MTDDDFAERCRRIGANIAALRRSRGMSQEDLAHAAGIHSVLVSRVERGATNPRLSTLSSLADGLGVELRELIDDRSAG